MYIRYENEFAQYYVKKGEKLTTKWHAIILFGVIFILFTLVTVFATRKRIIREKKEKLSLEMLPLKKGE